jgi:hypothetical protein
VEGMRTALSHAKNDLSNDLSIRSVILIEAELGEEEKLGELRLGHGVQLSAMNLSAK